MNQQKIYCGAKKRLPRNRIFGSANQCYLLGRAAGFYSGILKGQYDILKAQQNQGGIRPIPFQPVQIEAASQSIAFRKQREKQMKTEAQWAALSMREMQTQAKKWKIPNYSRSKTDLLNDFIREARRRNLVL